VNRNAWQTCDCSECRVFRALVDRGVSWGVIATVALDIVRARLASVIAGRHVPVSNGSALIVAALEERQALGRLFK
jgi:hypothetical protein